MTPVNLTIKTNLCMVLFSDEGWKPTAMLKLIKVARSKLIVFYCAFFAIF